MGIAALVLGILAIVLCFVPGFGVFGPIFGIVGIVLGAIARKKENGDKGIATGGFVCAIIGTVISLVGLIACAACIGATTIGASKAASELSSEFNKAANELTDELNDAKNKLDDAINNLPK